MQKPSGKTRCDNCGDFAGVGCNIGIYLVYVDDFPLNHAYYCKYCYLHQKRIDPDSIPKIINPEEETQSN